MTTKERIKSSTAARGQDRPIEASNITSSTDQCLRKTMGEDVGARKQIESRRAKEAEDRDFDTTTIGELREKVHRVGLSAQELQYVGSVHVASSAKEDCECKASDQPSSVDPEQSSLLPMVSDCFCPAPPTSSSLIRDEPMFEMSCETAASIITSMRGNGDREQARSQLGCKSGEHCSVKNMKVLQVMEMD
jgi:hypothetical protein